MKVENGILHCKISCVNKDEEEMLKGKAETQWLDFSIKLSVIHAMKPACPPGECDGETTVFAIDDAFVLDVPYKELSKVWSEYHSKPSTILN